MAQSAGDYMTGDRPEERLGMGDRNTLKRGLKRGLPSGGFYGIMFGYAGGISADGPSPSGKAQDFDSCIRGFESRWPSDKKGSENDCFQGLFAI